jgi:phage repressor protein C with HTH and peptisase S24 domain
MDTLGKRIAYYRKTAGLSQAGLASACGWKSQSRVGNYESGTREPTLADLEKIASAVGVSVSQLTYGELRHTLPRPSGAEQEAEPEYPRTPHEDDYALIPQYTAKGSCGAGFLNGHVEVKGSLAFKREWLAKMKAKPENLRVMYAHGESMEPYIFEGEVVLFDVSEKEPRDKKVFVIRRPDGDISIKRLAQRLDGTWVVSSDNPDKTRFRDETYLPDALHEIPIVGRVIWRGGEVD